MTGTTAASPRPCALEKLRSISGMPGKLLAGLEVKAAVLHDGKPFCAIHLFLVILRTAPEALLLLA